MLHQGKQELPCELSCTAVHFIRCPPADIGGGDVIWSTREGWYAPCCTELKPLWVTPTAVEPPELDKTKKRYPVVIPYVKGVSKQVRRVMKGYKLKVYIKPTNTLRQILVWPKDKVINERVVCLVYNISCDNCDESYFREMGRSLKSRFMEHSRQSSVNSEVSKHKLWPTWPQHKFRQCEDLEGGTEVVWERSEGSHPNTDQQPNAQQRCGRYNLPTIWNNTLRAIGRRGGPGPRTSKHVL